MACILLALQFGLKYFWKDCPKPNQFSHFFEIYTQKHPKTYSKTHSKNSLKKLTKKTHKHPKKTDIEN